MDLVLDAIDRRILRELQKDATVAIADLAQRVGLSQTPCWKRIRRLTDAGVITKRVVLLDREKLDLGLVVFAAASLPEVVEFYRLSGDTDYLLKVLVKDIAAYDAFYRRLIAAVPLSDVSSAFAMEQIKSTTALPI